MSFEIPQQPAAKTIPLCEGLEIGPGQFLLAAGPCAVESEEQMQGIAAVVAGAGANMLRGGAFKPRTSPDSFQGLGAEGLGILQAAARQVSLPVVTEVMDPREVSLVAEHADVLQVGSRNMQNIPLLRELGSQPRPVLLKRGAAATIDEFLNAAEYIRRGGNERIVLCERGIRGFDPSTRFVLDLTAVPVLKSRSELPVIVDPSHGTGHRHLVLPMARAAVAAGADGLLVEVHQQPEKALSDGPQALRPEDFSELVEQIRELLPMLGKALSPPRARSTSKVQASAR
ncbi:MAG: 3-deoxy-7-phosphoheptulonate synthase [Planctomycetota bacterium]